MSCIQVSVQLFKCALLIGVCTSGYAPPASAAVAAAPKKVVFLAGKESHHAYEKGLRLLKHCLDASPNLKGIVTELHTGGWPVNPATFDNADAIVLFSDGLDNQYPESQHPMLKDGHLKVFERQMKRGCGMVMIHWALWMPNKNGAEEVLDWVGGDSPTSPRALGNRPFPPDDGPTKPDTPSSAGSRPLS